MVGRPLDRNNLARAQVVRTASELSRCSGANVGNGMCSRRESRTADHSGKSDSRRVRPGWREVVAPEPAADAQAVVCHVASSWAGTRLP